MKAGFSLTKRYVPKFKDNDKLPGEEQMIAVLSMPTVEDVFTILDRLNDAGFKGGDSASVSIQQSAKIAKEAGEYLPKYIKLDNAEDFTLEDAIKYPPFFALSTELLFALVNFAQPNETDTKNS